MEDLIPLGPEDRAILALECRTVAGHTCKVVRLGPSALDVDRLRARVAERIGLAPALMRKLGGTAQAPGWRERLRSPFDGTIGTRREVAFASVPLPPLREAARELDGATVNDAVLTIVAGAIGRWLQLRHGQLGAIRVRVPVGLHHEGDAVANEDSFFSLALPLNELDPVARLRAVHVETSRRKAARDAQHREVLLAEVADVSPRLEQFLARLESSPRRFALSVSNVPGPHVPVSVLDAPVQRMHTIAEIGERHALRVSALSLAGLLCFGFCADPGLVENLQAMADGVEAEAQQLLRAAGIA